MASDSTTHPTLSMLLTHTTYVWVAREPTVVRRETTSLLPKRELLVSRKTRSVSTRELIVSLRTLFVPKGIKWNGPKSRGIISVLIERRVSLKHAGREGS